MKIPQIELTLEPESYYQQVLLDGKPKLICSHAEIQAMLNEFVAAAPFPKKVRSAIKKLVPQIQKILKIDSVVIIPLMMKGKAVGVFDISSTGIFAESDIERLNTIAEQVTSAIVRVQSEEKLRQSEEQYHSVVEDSPGLIDRFLLDGTITFVNQESCRFFGKKYDELIGTNITSQILEEDREKVMSGIASLTVESPVRTFENKVIRHDGEIRWMRWTDHALFDNKGKINSIQSFGEDITERKQAQEKLKISEERFRAFMENVPAFAYILNKDLGHIYGNSASIEADGYSTLEDYIGTSIKNNYPDEISDEIEANSKRVINEGCITNQEFTVVMNDGKPHTLLDIKFPIQLPDGDTQVGGLAIDITERVQAEDTIQQERDIAQKYLDIAEVMILALNREGEITLINQKGASILGYQIKELMGKNWFDTCLLAADRRQSKEGFNKFLASEVKLVDHFEKTVLTKTGEERIIDWHSTPLWEWDDDEKHRIGSLSSGEDITERVRAEQALQESEEKLRNIIENSTNMFYSHTADHLLTYVSPQSKQIFGYEPEEMFIKWTDLTTDNPINQQGFLITQEAINTGKPQPPYELELIGKKGQRI